MEGLAVAYKRANTIGTTNIKDRNGEFYGWTCQSSNSGTITVYDHESSASGNILFGPVNLVAGQSFNFSSIAIRCARGITVVLGGTAADINVLYN